MRILVVNRVKTTLDSFPEEFRKKAVGVIWKLPEEVSLGRKLKGALSNERSAPLGRSHRIMYSIENDVVTVLAILARRDSFR